MLSRRNLIFFTDAFPLGNVETEPNFILPEIKYLAEKFERVIVVPTMDFGSVAHQLPANVEVSRFWIDSAICRRKAMRLKFLLRPSFWKMVSPKSKPNDLTFIAVGLAFEEVFKDWLQKEKLTPENTLLYSFWFDIAAAGIALLLRREHYRWISRAHGHDMFTRRGGKLRKLMIDRVFRLLPACRAGADFLKRELKCPAEKLRVSILGCSKDHHGIVAKKHSPTDKTITFLSVARLVPLKRVELNFRFIKKLAQKFPDFAFNWIHAGDGESMPSLKKEIASTELPENLRISLRGKLSNREVREIYETEQIDWLMLLSTSEGGHPIAVCEAFAYGVPAIVADSTGMAEAVTPECGVKLSPNPTADEFVGKLSEYILQPNFKKKLDQGAFARWEKYYNSDKLRREFVNSDFMS